MPRVGRGHRLHQGGQPPGQLPDPLHRLRVRHRPGGRPARRRTCSAPSPAWPAARSCTRGPTWRPSAAGSTPRSLAEDTFTTFETQLRGRRVVFEPHATVLGRGTRRHRGPVEAAAALGARQRPGHHAVPQAVVPAAPRSTGSAASPSAVFWFCLFLLPVFMITGVGVAAHPVLQRLRAWPGSRSTCCGSSTRLTYVFITVVRAAHGPAAPAAMPGAGRCVFPGAINLSIIIGERASPGCCG